MNAQDLRKLVGQTEIFQIENIISNSTEDERIEILMDIDLIKNKLNFGDFQIRKFIEDLSSDEAKDKLVEIYQYTNYDKIEVLKTCSNNHKLEVLLKEKSFNKYDITDILETLDAKTLSKFLLENKEFYSEKGIHPYDIIRKLDEEQQKEFLMNLENIDLTLNEKKEILATLKTNVKQSIDTANFPEEYKLALSMETTDIGRVVLDFERNPEDYRGLDSLIRINPEKFTEEQRKKLIELCDICPNMDIFNNVSVLETSSSPAEYKEAEKWINSIIDNLNPAYSKAQKMAVIDNAIGKKISYSPDFEVETFNINDCRAIWKIISSGYGVCNGIAKLEQYILNRVGIESEMISSGRHSFLKIKNIEIPLANGDSIKGDTILDPTWNLTTHRFGAKPNNFCISYEQARKGDIDINGKDHNSHKNDEKLQDVTLNLDEESLRSLFTSVGLADKDGQFPIKDLLEKSELLHKSYANEPELNINKQLSLLKQACPEFATCQNSSMSILSGTLLNSENLKFNKCVVSRVYNKEDKDKRPVLFVYIDLNELGNKFYYANKEEGEFIELPQKEFVKQFECYEEDLEENKRT